MNPDHLNSIGGDSSKTKIDTVDFQRRQRQLLNELKIKRDQVTQLKKELDPASLKIHELNRALETAKSTIEEQQHNLNLALKNSRFLEDKLQSKRDNMCRTHLQQESAVQERERIRELLQRTELQNINLVRELNELKAQRNCDTAYQKDLVNQDAQIRAKIAKLSEAIQKFELDHNQMTELTNKIDLCESLQKATYFYRDELNKCNNKQKKLEKDFIKANAALQKYETLISAKTNTNISEESCIIIQQWQQAVEHFNKQQEFQKTVLENLTTSLKIEKEANERICIHQTKLEDENQKLLKENEELKRKLTCFIKDYKDCGIQTDMNVETIAIINSQIKSEVIEIP